MGLVPNKKIYFEFLYYLLKYHKDNISNIGGGTTFKEVSGATLGLFKVKIPPTYYEQTKNSPHAFCFRSKNREQPQNQRAFTHARL